MLLTGRVWLNFGLEMIFLAVPPAAALLMISEARLLANLV